jgi:hypothetical protein
MTERRVGRFAFHALLHAYAKELAQAAEPPDERRRAVHRMLDYCLHRARQAAVLIRPTVQLADLAPAQRGVIGECFRGYEQAMTWLEAERQVLLAIIAEAGAAGFYEQAADLPAALADFLAVNVCWSDYTATQ